MSADLKWGENLELLKNSKALSNEELCFLITKLHCYGGETDSTVRAVKTILECRERIRELEKTIRLWERPGTRSEEILVGSP